MRFIRKSPFVRHPWALGFNGLYVAGERSITLSQPIDALAQIKASVFEIQGRRWAPHFFDGPLKPQPKQAAADSV